MSANDINYAYQLGFRAGVKTSLILGIIIASILGLIGLLVISIMVTPFCRHLQCGRRDLRVEFSRTHPNYLHPLQTQAQREEP